MNYGSASYWDERYAAIGDRGEKNYDWYCSWAQLQRVLRSYLPKPKGAVGASGDASFEILIPGCGSSTLGAHLYKEGFTNITNIDSSSVLVNQMSELYAELDQMEFTTMDACSMEFIPDNCFNMIIDKALFDCMLCNPANMSTITKLVPEMYRVLKPGGVYVLVSHGPPETREGFLVGDEEHGLRWTITSTVIAKPPINDTVEQVVDQSFYVYFCKKAA